MKPHATQSIGSASSTEVASFSNRCIHRTPAGRRCQSEAVDPQASFCRRHLFGSARRYPDPSLASELLGTTTEFHSASDVTDFLSRLLILQAKDRIAPRRAAVMAYTCNLLLRGLRAVGVENRSSDDQDDFPEPLMDLIRRKREIAAQQNSAPSAAFPAPVTSGQPS